MVENITGIDFSNLVINQPTLAFFLGITAFGFLNYFKLLDKNILFWSIIFYCFIMGLFSILHILNQIWAYYKKCKLIYNKK